MQYLPVINVLKCVFDWKPQRPLACALNSISLKFVHENCSLKINRSIIVEYPMYKRQSMTITFSYKYTPHTPKSRLSNANTSFHLGLLISDLVCIHVHVGGMTIIMMMMMCKSFQQFRRCSMKINWIKYHKIKLNFDHITLAVVWKQWYAATTGTVNYPSTRPLFAFNLIAKVI